MKILIVAAVMVVAVSARTLKITGLADCGGPGAPITFSGSVLTDPVPVPGNMSMDLITVTGVAATASDGLILRKVTTRTTDNYQVPCLNGIAGSCTVNLCDAIATYPEYVCSVFPPDLPCECPIAAGTYNAPINAYVFFDDAWLVVDGGATGDYATRTEIIANSGLPNEFIIGCLDLQYTLLAA